MVQFADIIRVARHCYLETGEMAGVQAIGLGMCEDAALDALQEFAPANEDAQAYRLDPAWLDVRPSDYELLDADVTFPNDGWLN